jgi:hypothetical protein
MSSLAEIFPPDDPLARFMLAICMARNDVRYAVFQAGAAIRQNSQELLNYWVRISNGHYFEAMLALDSWRKKEPEVRRFIKRLPDDARDALAVATRNVQTLGFRTLADSRNRTFHYPSPGGRYPSDGELKAAMHAFGREVTMVVEGDGYFRLQFADQIALALALHKHDPARIEEQLQLARDGKIAFINFATRAWEQYREKRHLSLGEPRSADGKA